LPNRNGDSTCVMASANSSNMFSPPDGSSTITNRPPKKSLTFYTYHAQLTFGLPLSQEVNVAALFAKWVAKSCTSLVAFSLLPSDSKQGQQVTSPDQIPGDDASFYAQYYHKHRILQHGNLTGIIHFQTATPWTYIKSFKNPYFAWLRENKVFINYTKFKTDTLVPCSFLVGAHPGFLRRTEAEEELLGSLGLDAGQIPFQLTSHTISVPIQEGAPSRYSFQAVVVECSAADAPKLRERFYDLDRPNSKNRLYPYTGLYQFVPCLKSKDWPIDKIYRLAQLHVAILEDLKPIHITNLQDINHVIAESGDSLLHVFYTMPATKSSGNAPSITPDDQLVHSIHNSGNSMMKVALVHSAKFQEALDTFSNIGNILYNSIQPEYHPFVFVPGMQPALSSNKPDSLSSGTYLTYASELLSPFNPQDGGDSPPPIPKRF
jgi:hypothetical protein